MLYAWNVTDHIVNTKVVNPTVMTFCKKFKLNMKVNIKVTKHWGPCLTQSWLEVSRCLNTSPGAGWQWFRRQHTCPTAGIVDTGAVWCVYVGLFEHFIRSWLAVISVATYLSHSWNSWHWICLVCLRWALWTLPQQLAGSDFGGNILVPQLE